MIGQMEIYAAKRILIHPVPPAVNPAGSRQGRLAMYTDAVGCIFMKHRRQAAIRDVVARDEVRSQEQLRHRLAARGFAVTQATLSRDIKELGLVKRASDGAYQDGGEDVVASGPGTLQALQRTLADCLTGLESSQQLIVLRTGTGQAQLLGVALDRARLREVLGTIAGDDTVLVICRNVRAARSVVQRFEALATRSER
jgi:transcriptional regulator of arginine metabolism